MLNADSVKHAMQVMGLASTENKLHFAIISNAPRAHL